MLEAAVPSGPCPDSPGGGGPSCNQTRFREAGWEDGQRVWRVLLVQVIRSLVPVTQVLSKEELGPTAGVNLGSSAYLRLPKTGNGGRRRLVNIVCLGTVSSMKGDERHL